MIATVTRAGAFAGRMADYFREMLPLPRHLALAALIHAAIAVFARHAHGLSTSLLSVHGAVALASLFLLMVILRLMDELKDEDIDRRLFPDRPLPSGRVRRDDIRRTLRVVSLLYVVVNLGMGWACLAAVVVLGYAGLMYRHFFAPEALRRSLPLTLATHNPIVALMVGYGLAVFAAEHGLSSADLRWSRIIPFVVMTWTPFLAWEISRKIRCRREEDDYVTYSRILGPRGAVVTVWLVQAIGVGLGLHLERTLHLHWIAGALIVAAFLANLASGVRFLLCPSPRTSRLKPFTTVFLLAILGSQILGVVAR